MTTYTDQERAYATLHQDYVDGYISEADYRAGFDRIKAQARPKTRHIWPWALPIAVVLLGLACLVAQALGLL